MQADTIPPARHAVSRTDMVVRWPDSEPVSAAAADAAAGAAAAATESCTIALPGKIRTGASCAYLRCRDVCADHKG